MSDSRTSNQIVREFLSDIVKDFGRRTRDDYPKCPPWGNAIHVRCATVDAIREYLRTADEPRVFPETTCGTCGGTGQVPRAAEPAEAVPEELTERLLAEADLCRNDGATDIAKLLEDAAKQNEVHWRTRRMLLRQLESTAEPPSPDTDPNAPWLSIAHSLCSDLGIAPGRIYDRMLALSEELRRPPLSVSQAQVDLGEQLLEVETVLKENGWHTDRGLLKRVTDVLDTYIRPALTKGEAL